MCRKGRQAELVKGVLSVLQSRFDLSSNAVERITQQLQQVDDVEVLRRLLVTAPTAERLDEFQAALERADGFTDVGAG